MSQLSPGREERKTLSGNACGPDCKPALVPLIYATFLRRNRRVFGSELLYVWVWL